MIRTESILKRIRFKFRVDYDAEDGGKVLLNETTVETVVCLYHQKNDFISVPYEPKGAEYLNQYNQN